MTQNTTIQIDPIVDSIGTIVIVQTTEKRFAARLIALKGDELWFESKRGARWMHNRSDIIGIFPGKQVA
jgi:hypothetical protein